MNDELSFSDLVGMDSVGLAGYIRDRLTLNNYGEAQRAALAMLVRLQPEPVEGIDALVGSYYEYRTGRPMR